MAKESEVIHDVCNFYEIGIQKQIKTAHSVSEAVYAKPITTNLKMFTICSLEPCGE